MSTRLELWQWVNARGRSEFDVGDQIRRTGVQHRFRTLSFRPDELPFDLRWLPALHDTAALPTQGQSLIVVADVRGVLHVRIFDRDAKLVVDTEEGELPQREGQVAELRRQLQGLGPPHGPSAGAKGRVIAAVTSLVEYSRSSRPTGNAWYIQFDIKPRQPDSIEAYQGRYAFQGDRLAEDVLLLRIDFTRQYVGRALTRLDWEVDTAFTADPLGVRLEIPLQGRRLPEGNLPFVVIEASHPGSSSMLARDRAAGTKPHDFLAVGDVFELTDAEVEHEDTPWVFISQLKLQPPPGFRLHRDPRGPIREEVLGVAFYNMGATELGSVHIEKAIEEAPEAALPLLYRARIRLDESAGPTRSIDELHWPLQQNTDELRKKRADALRDLDAAIALDPQLADAYYLRFVARLAPWKPRTTAEIEDLRRAMTLEPRNSRYVNALAFRHLHIPDRDYRRARQYAERACELSEWSDSGCLETLAHACAGGGDLVGAIRWIQQAMERLPKGEEYREKKRAMNGHYIRWFAQQKYGR